MLYRLGVEHGQWSVGQPPPINARFITRCNPFVLWHQISGVIDPRMLAFDIIFMSVGS